VSISAICKTINIRMTFEYPKIKEKKSLDMFFISDLSSYRKIAKKICDIIKHKTNVNVIILKIRNILLFFLFNIYIDFSINLIKLIKYNINKKNYFHFIL
jgi:hypothetical protein